MTPMNLTFPRGAQARLQARPPIAGTASFRLLAGATMVSTSIAWGCLTACSLAASRDEPSDEPDPQPRVVIPDDSGRTASPSDGGGTVSVTPDLVQVSAPVTMTFVYAAGDRGIAVGGGIACHVSNFWGWTPPQTDRPDRPGYTSVRTSAPDVRLDVVIDPKAQAVIARVAGAPLMNGRQVTFTYGDTSDGRRPQARGLSDRFAERDERFFFKVDGDGDGWYTPISRQPTFRVEATHPAKLCVFGPSWARLREPFELTIAVLDDRNNLVESFAGEVMLHPRGVEVEGPRKVTLRPDDRGAVRVSLNPVISGLLRVSATDPARTLRAHESNPIVVSSEADLQYRLYWADLQGHCNVCDGTGTPEDFYRYARDVARLDVVALTDHDHWGYQPLDGDPATWRRLCQLSKSNYQPGKFVAFPGYEWTNWTFGHQHVLFLREADAEVFAWNSSASDRPDRLWHRLQGRQCLTIPHHPGGDPIPICWKYYNPSVQPVVEMASVHGVSEFVGHPRSIAGPVASGMAQAALARGYKLGMIGSGDTHDGHPGLGSPDARAGLAGIYATQLTREAVFEALRARRVFSTTGCRAILRFKMGEHPMGSLVRLASASEPRSFSVMVLGDARIASVSIIKNNRQAASYTPGELIASWEWTDPEEAEDGDYYYARIVQTDNEWIWSSPIFIELGQPGRR